MKIEKKKILLAVTKSNWGGAQRYVFDIASNLDKDIYEVAVLCGGEGILVEKLRALGIRVITLPYLDRNIKIFDEFRGLFDLIKIFRTEAPDTLHLNSPKIGGLGALAGRISGVKNILYTAHGWPFFEDRNFLSKVLMVFFSWLTTIFTHKIIVISKQDYRAALKFPFTTNKIILIYNGIGAINFFEKEEARKELVGEEVKDKHALDFWVTTVSELHKNKNIETSIKGVVSAKNNGQNIFYVIVGEGEERENLLKLVEKEGAGGYIKLIGFKKDAAHYLKAFDCFLLTSKKEGLPYAILEAGLAQLTVITTPVGGIPEIVEDKINGYLINKPAEDNISSTFKAAEKFPLGVNLKEKVREKFSLKVFIDEIEKMYN